ncbi:MAG: hypothetical protein HRU38_25345 [Saccharospirillaceae bacterium]|nr:hypothetical protein [Pseudomonadales bacterium]NRB81943.1 hypothetical protein [Saccharospirillaceae bacterium]
MLSIQKVSGVSALFVIFLTVSCTKNTENALPDDSIESSTITVIETEKSQNNLQTISSDQFILKTTITESYELESLRYTQTVSFVIAN